MQAIKRDLQGGALGIHHDDAGPLEGHGGRAKRLAATTLQPISIHRSPQSLFRYDAGIHDSRALTGGPQRNREKLIAHPPKGRGGRKVRAREALKRHLDGEPTAALATTARQDRSPCLTPRAAQKPVRSRTLSLFRLIGPFHSLIEYGV